MEIENKLNRSIKTDFLVRAALLVMLTITSIVSYNYFAGKSAAIESAKSNLQKLNSLFISSAVNFIVTSRNIPQNGSVIFPSENLTEEQMIPIKKYMFNLLDTSNLTTSVMFILNSGYFITLDKILDKKDPQQTDHIEKAHYILHIIDERAGSAQKKWLYYDKNHDLIHERIDTENTIDFRNYKWYKRSIEMAQTNWSNIHLLHRSNAPGITIAAPIYDDNKKVMGSFAIDTSVREFSSFINEMRITDNTHAYIIDSDEKIIADSDMTETISSRNGLISILGATDLNDSVLSKALEIAKKNPMKSKNILSGDVFDFTADNGISYIASLSDFPPKIGLNWKVISLTPTSVFSEIILSIQKNSIYLALMILFIALTIAYFQAQKFSDPISELVVEATKIKNLELEDGIYAKTSIQEINELNTAMEDMKFSLKNISKYIPRALSKEFMNSGQEVHLGGKTQELTILFSDIANFTAVSETISPTDLMHHLSEYFEELTKIILIDKGTIDKFMGDAIMAFWGAPTPDNNQSTHACHAALLCQQKLKTLNKFWHSLKRPPLVTRIGIHCGNAVVGNVGSSERMNYTAIGDSVNLASRLEGINKLYNTNILISEEVRIRLPNRFIVRPIDIVAVKGKTKSTKIFELVGATEDERIHPLSQHAVDFCAQFTEAFDLYMDKEWEKARQLFSQLLTKNAEIYHIDDLLTADYIKKCDDLIQNPPEKWDKTTHLNLK